MSAGAWRVGVCWCLEVLVSACDSALVISGAWWCLVVSLGDFWCLVMSPGVCQCGPMSGNASWSLYCLLEPANAC